MVGRHGEWAGTRLTARQPYEPEAGNAGGPAINLTARQPCEPEGSRPVEWCNSVREALLG
ncbi:hypothetical protein CF166_30330 [Amycolatopsis sp. KNN50.9b]|nr:hypothetical protein CF166_30330 [Amycolatopsis sp. KNN50.9b]